MTDAVLTALIAAIPPTLVATGTLILAMKNRVKLNQVEQQVDGRLTQLLELTRKSSHAEGMKEELNKEKG